MSRKLDLSESYFRERSTVDANGCWVWDRFRSNAGYGRTRAGWSDYREQQAHRLAYRVLRNDGAPITGEIDHLCRNRACVNPAHLEDVPHQINMQRAPHNSLIAPRAAQTHCAQGHAFDEANTGHSAGQRYCRSCKRERTRTARHAVTK